MARLAVGPPAATPGDQVPDGRGPWTFVVEAVGAARAGQQTATLRSSDGAATPFRVAATLPAYPEVTPGDRLTIEGPIRPRPDSPYGDYLERIGAIGTLTARSMDGGATAGRRLACDRSRSAGRRLGARRRAARTGSGARGGHPRRTPRPRRPRPGGRLHHRRRQPRRGDLGLEHRDRRRGDRGDGRPDEAPTTLDPDDGRDRRLRRLRRGFGIGRPCRGDGRCRAAGPRVRTCRAGGRGARRGPR